MRFLEYGTRAHGPVTKKFLYIPLNRKAAMGWTPDLKSQWAHDDKGGAPDYLLVKWVAGIAPRGIAEAERKLIKPRLLEEITTYLQQVRKGIQVGAH